MEIIHLQYSFILPDHPGYGQLGLVLAHPWQLETLEVSLPSRQVPPYAVRETGPRPGMVRKFWGKWVLGKKRKSITTRNPPVPSDNHTEIADWITRGVMPDMHMDHPNGGLRRLRERHLLGRGGLRPSSAARSNGSESLRQADDLGGSARAGDAEVDRASRAHVGVEVRIDKRKTSTRRGPGETFAVSSGWLRVRALTP